ncbi:hypothetical protein [Sorangium sp. So ce1335]|uniref:hypothetical protein n=1 Tax=Sorangium sp. So ce1335 TaxID=3133335 RepID=UPI003F5FD07C
MMPHRLASFPSLLVLLGALAAGCQGSQSGAPTTPPPVETGRGTEAVGVQAEEDAGSAGDPTGAGGAPAPGAAQGCGVDGPLIKYVGQSQDACARIRFVCDPGWSYFSDDCGCGCTKQP